MADRTLYDELHVTPDAPYKVIRAAYRVLSQQYHPDRRLEDDNGLRMRQINSAWAVLSDASARADYDDRMRRDIEQCTNAGDEVVRPSRPAGDATARAQDERQVMPPWVTLLLTIALLVLATILLSSKSP